MSLKEDVFLRAKLLRRAVRRARQRMRYPGTPMEEMPILFANSFPKSGTHLLTQILTAFSKLGPAVDSGLPPILTFEGPSGEQRSLEAIMGDLKRLRPGDVAYGHLHAQSEIVAHLCREGVAPFFIYRDPRDVVVSHVYYVTEMAIEHVHHQHYRYELKDFDERLRTSILGRPDVEVPFPDIGARFAPYLPWLERDEMLSLRFEDLIEESKEALERILDHAVGRGFLYEGERERAIEVLADEIDPKQSPTFRSGKSGAWREHFNEEHKRLFKQVAGEVLVRLGYEKDQNW